MEQNKLLTMEEVKKQEIPISKKTWEKPTIVEISKSEILGAVTNPGEAGKTLT